VKLLRVENDRFVFQLGHREKDLLTIILRLYPVIPSAHQPLGKSSKAPEQTQHLLDEALMEQRKENKKAVEALLAEPGRFREVTESLEMTLTASEIEWLLQVLNDVQVGNWILMGSPGERPRFTPNVENAAQVWAMELATIFQVDLLDAINRNS
jgi:thiamine kinase-like enzyme